MAEMDGIALQRLGGTYQAVIEKPGDLGLLSRLDETRWVATSIPIESLACDEKFARYVDTDQNGRIRADELKAAQQWLFHMLADRGHLAEGTATLRLADVDTRHDDGRNLCAAAQRILANLGVPDATEITLDQVRSRQAIFAQGLANGDGIIPPGAVEDPGLAEFIKDVLATAGGAPDASGSEGVDAAALDRFLAEARAYLDWHAAGRIPAGEDHTDVMVWGDDTPGAYKALTEVEARIDDYFARCAAARFERLLVDGSAGVAPLPASPAIEAPSLEDRLRAAPLAPLNPEAVLPLDDTLNPLDRAHVRLFSDEALSRALGGEVTSLTQEQWGQVKAMFQAYRAWQAGKKGACVEPLGVEKLRACVEGPLPDALRRLIAEDEEAAADLKQLENLERLVLYQQGLMQLANNMVSLSELFDPGRTSLVEMGTLIMDGRRFTFNVRVTHRAAHKAVAAQSRICVLYLEVVGRDGNDKFDVATAVTAGEARGLRVGKRGIFYTTDGREWDAVVVDMIPNPIGLGEALRAPFARIGDFIEKQIERFTSARYTDLEKEVGKHVSTAEKSVADGTRLLPGSTGKADSRALPAPGPALSRSGAIRDLLLGGGVAVAALGSSFAFIARTLTTNTSTLVVALVGLVMVVMVPTAIMAIVRLKRRSLTPILEACGWAMNANIRLTRDLGVLFTRVHPRRRSLLTWILAIVMAALVGYGIGWQVAKHFQQGAPRKAASVSVPGGKPAAPTPAAAQTATAPQAAAKPAPEK